jgi:hypothetical protein
MGEILAQIIGQILADGLTVNQSGNKRQLFRKRKAMQSVYHLQALFTAIVLVVEAFIQTVGMFLFPFQCGVRLRRGF